MSINPDKYHTLTISLQKHRLEPPSPLHVLSKQSSWGVQFLKLLGLVISHDLSCVNHISKLASKHSLHIFLGVLDRGSSVEPSPSLVFLNTDPLTRSSSAAWWTFSTPVKPPPQPKPQSHLLLHFQFFLPESLILHPCYEPHVSFSNSSFLPTSLFIQVFLYFILHHETFNRAVDVPLLHPSSPPPLSAVPFCSVSCLPLPRT